MAKNWIQGAIKHPGALKRKARKAGKSTHEFAEEHKGEEGPTGRQSRLAITLGKMRRHGRKTRSHAENLYPSGE